MEYAAGATRQVLMQFLALLVEQTGTEEFKKAATTIKTW
jgi:hypothetical protein